MKLVREKIVSIGIDQSTIFMSVSLERRKKNCGNIFILQYSDTVEEYVIAGGDDSSSLFSENYDETEREKIGGTKKENNEVPYFT